MEAVREPSAIIETVTGVIPNNNLNGNSDTDSCQHDNNESVWDPMQCSDWDGRMSNDASIRRIQAEIRSFITDSPGGIFVCVPDEIDLSRIHILIVGPKNTPYEGGFFYFLWRMSPNHPFQPPRARLLTTCGDTVSFNPCIHQNGKVCLSALSNQWSPVLVLRILALEFQSALFNEQPYYNEPGYENERQPGDSDRYNTIIQYETLRVAVCEMMEEQRTESQNLPDTLKQSMHCVFVELVDTYIANCQKLIDRGLQGTAIDDPFGRNRGTFDPSGVMERLLTLKSSVATKFSN